MTRAILYAVGMGLRIFVNIIRYLSQEKPETALLAWWIIPLSLGFAASIYNWNEGYHQLIQMITWIVAGALMQVGIKQARDLFWKPSTSFGSARLARDREIKKLKLHNGQGLILGRRKGKVLRYSGPGHLLTFAPTRSGKGVGGVIPNLLDHQGSAVVIDIKGENQAITRRFRKSLGDVVALAPFSADIASQSYNPLDFIRTGTSFEVSDATLLADLLVSPHGHDTYFDQEARYLIMALILYVNSAYPEACRNLGEVSNLIHKDEEQFDAHLADMMNAENDAVARRMAAFSQKEPKERSHVISTAQSHMAVWSTDHPLHEATKKSDFQLDEIKSKVLTLYVVVPPEYLQSYRSFMRVVVGLSIASMSRTKVKPENPVVFFLDEIAALGHMPVIENAIGYIAGYGVQLWMFFQDLDQLQKTYTKWRSVLANCAVKQTFNVSDTQTAKEVSNMLGVKTVQFRSHSRSLQNPLSFTSHQENDNQASRPLLTADEVVNLPKNKLFLFVQGCRPVLADKIRYFDWFEWRFWGKWDRFE